jgi:ribosome-binding factor A
MGHEGGHRHQRLQQLIDEELTSLLRDEVQDPRLDDVHITGVELSIDYKNARVRYIVADESKGNLAKVDKAFERAAPFLRARLGVALDLKKLPTLSFMFDRDAAAAKRAAAVLADPKNDPKNDNDKKPE